MLWLVCRGADINNLADNNGCSPVHWAAYENDGFTLYFLKAVGVEINLLDN
jgi:ankyrin repeat protein